MLARMARFGQRMRESMRAFGAVYRNRGWAYIVSLAVFAYHQDGAYAVGGLAVARWVTSGIAAPIAGVVGDRYPRVRVLIASCVVRSAMIGLAGVVMLAGLSSFAVYVLAVLAAIAGTVFSPSEAALVPTLARSPEELTAANVSASTIDGVGTFLGPALGGFLLAATSTETVFFVSAGLVALAAIVVSGVPEPPREPRDDKTEDGAIEGGLAGFKTVLGD